MDLRTIRADWPEDPVAVLEVCALTEADLRILATTEKGFAGTTSASPIKRIGERHRALARMLSGGASPGEAAILTGYDASRISILLSDPTFKELLEFYRNEVDTEYITMHSQLAGLGEDALAEMRRRVEETPEDIGFSTLLDVVVKIADRTGNGPTSTSRTEVSVTIDLAARMKAARARAAEAIDGLAIDITPKAAAE